MEGNSAVDILWTIDNSGSMGDHQRDVIANANSFISQFTQSTALEWRMGLVSTDTQDEPYVGLIPGTELNYLTPNAVTKFQQAVRRLGTTRRADGSLQVTYAGRPLYYYIGDRRPGQILCQGASEYGGIWRVIRPSGELVKRR